MTAATQTHDAGPVGQLLGEVVSWDMKSREVAYDEVVDALDAAGLDSSAAKELSNASAFGRACSHLKENRTIDKLSVENGVAQFQFTAKHLAGGLFSYSHECVVELELATGAITCPENPAIADHARELFAFAHRTRTTQDVTRLVQKMFAEHADLIPICPRKGVAYFVPERHRGFSAKVDQFLQALGGGLARFPVPKGTDEGNRSVRDAVQTSLNGVLTELDATVEGWDEKTRKSTMERAFAQWEKIAYKTEAYAEYLGTEQAMLRDKLEEAKAKLAEKISRFDDEPAGEPSATSEPRETGELAAAQ